MTQKLDANLTLFTPREVLEKSKDFINFPNQPNATTKSM